VDLTDRFCDPDGWFVCPECHQPSGYVPKEFPMQEKDREPWRPFLRGVVRLWQRFADDPDSAYRPFVFLANYGDPAGAVTDCWFCYYKDTRAQGGRLKQGHGPGGPPVLGVQKELLDLIRHLLRCRTLSHRDLEALLDDIN